MQHVVEATPEGGYVDDLVPEVIAQLSSEALVDRATVEAEIDLMFRTVREFWQMEPDQVLLTSSALSARCAELEAHLHRVETKREWMRVRTMQVERLHKEIELQFKVHSRLIEMRRQDLELSRGMR